MKDSANRAHLNYGTTSSKIVSKKKEFQIIRLSSACLPLETGQPQSEAWVQLQSQLQHVTCVEDQMEVIKTISDHLLQANYEQHGSLDLSHLVIAVDLYLSSPLKHPAKCALAKTFNVVHKHCKSACVPLLREGLLSRIEFAIGSQDLTDISIASSALLGCCDNFLLGPEIVDSIFVNVLQFSEKALSLCYSSLSSSITPTLKVEVNKAIHTITRIVITTLQRTEAADNSFLSSQSCKEHLENILDIAVHLLKSSEVPLDTRINFGLVVVLIQEFLQGSEGWMQLLKTDTSAQKEDEMSHLCICYGLLSGLKKHQFLLLHTVKKKAIISCILDVALSINERCAQESNLVLALWRVVQQLTRVLVSNPQLVSCLEVSSVELLLSNLWGLLDHFMDTVRHLAKSIFENITQLKDSFLDMGIDLADKMCEAFLLIPETKRSRYVILSTLTVHLSTSEIITRIPNVINNLLIAMQCPSMSSHVSGAFKTMAESDFKKRPYSEWYHFWVVPLFERIKMDSSESPALEDALSKLIKLCPKIISQVLPDVKNEKGFDLPRLKILLTCMKIGRKLGVLLPGFNEGDGVWFGLLPNNILQSALSHECDEIRLTALALVVETSRSTESLSQTDLMFVRMYLMYNLSCEVPSVRQQSLAYVFKLLNRMKDSAHTLIRSSRQKKKENSLNILEDYKSFFLWTITFLYDNLKIGSNYSSRFCSLKILTFIPEVLTNDLFVAAEDWQQIMWTDLNALTLLGVILTDTFEENKAMATKIFLSYPHDTLALHDNQKLFNLFQKGCSLASSNHPSDCISAAYLIELCCGFYSKSSNLAINKNISCCAKALDILSAINYLKTQLEDELNVAQRDILLAASKCPMYGSLFCIRHLMQLITDFSKLDSSWQSMVKSMVDLCFKLNYTVLPVVNSSSPEGHLPMDFNQGSTLLSGDTCSQVSSPSKVTAQMVLLCAWRTVKEVSLFLGNLSNVCPIIPETNGLLGEKEVLAIGVHLTTLLEETKHRGAFEQAYVGFSLLAARLWRHPKRSLQELPQKWLNELMEAIQKNEPTESKLCATRRSAGVPFLVQALVSGELQAGTSHQSLQMTMSLLLACASNKENHVESRTHSLNILRALYRHAPLAEHVGPYISNGVIVALTGFRGKTWAERNSATLLFSSLMTRIFGVRRSRDELSSRNKMTGRVFFHRYPELYEFLLMELEQAVSALDMGDVSKLSIVHPILLLIARLYPSSLEGTDTPMQLSTFIPLVRHCASNSVLKTRVLAAKAIVPLITVNVLNTYLDGLIQQMVHECSENLTHGLGLQIVHLLCSYSTLNEDQAPEFIDYLQPWLTKLLTCLEKSPSKPVCEIIYQVFELVLQKWFSFVPSHVWTSLKDILSSNILPTTASCLESQPSLGQSICEIRVTRVLLQVSILLPDNQSEAIILELLRHKSYEVVQEVLVTLERLMCEDVTGIFEDIEDILPDIFDSDKHWMERLPKHNVSAFCLMLSKSNCLGRTLASLVSLNTDIRGKLALRVLPHICPSSWCTDVHSKHLLEWLSSPHEGTSCAALACFSSLLKYVVESKEGSPSMFEEGCKFLKVFCAEDKSIRSRMAAVNFHLQHREALERKYSFLSDETVCELWMNVIKLTFDDNSQVRKRAALIPQMHQPSVPLKSQESLLDSFLSVMSGAPQHCLATLLALSLGPLPDSSSFEDDEERVFDKGETNLFAEPEVVTDLICKYILPLVSQGKTMTSIHWTWVWLAIGGNDLQITSSEDLFDAIRLFNTSGLSLVDSEFLFPLPVVCSLRRLYKVEMAYNGVSNVSKSNCFPFDSGKLLGSTFAF